LAGIVGIRAHSLLESGAQIPIKEARKIPYAACWLFLIAAGVVI